MSAHQIAVRVPDGESWIIDIRGNPPTQRFCIACGTTRRFMPWLRSEHVTGYVGEMERCSICGLGHLWPDPTDEQLARAYSNTYYANTEKPSSTNLTSYLSLNKLAGRASLLGFARIVTLPAIEWLAGRSIPPKYRIPLSLPPFTRILDYGCGSAHYLMLLDAIGLKNLTGFDIVENKVATTQLPHCSFHNASTITAANYPASSFDFITAIQTFEHVPDPLAVFRELKPLLAPGGRLLVEVPNIASRSSERSPATFGHLALPVHLWHYTPESLRLIGERAGLRHMATLTSYSPVTEGHVNLGLVSRALRARQGLIHAALQSATELTVVFA